MTQAAARSDLHMDTAIDNFGHAGAAEAALHLAVATAARELPGADARRAAHDWPALAQWVHRTRGALVLFGAPSLRARGERFEEVAADPARQAEAGRRFDAYRTALGHWLAVAADLLAARDDQRRCPTEHPDM